jgi:hypothetical protein
MREQSVFKTCGGEDQEEDEEEKAFWEIRDARLRRRVTTTVYVNKRTRCSSGRIGLTLFLERQMTSITTHPWRRWAYSLNSQQVWQAITCWL